MPVIVPVLWFGILSFHPFLLLGPLALVHCLHQALGYSASCLSYKALSLPSPRLLSLPRVSGIAFNGLHWIAPLGVLSAPLAGTVRLPLFGTIGMLCSPPPLQALWTSKLLFTVSPNHWVFSQYLMPPAHWTLLVHPPGTGPN